LSCEPWHSVPEGLARRARGGHHAPAHPLGSIMITPGTTNEWVDVGGLMMAVGVGILGGGVLRSFILHGKRERRFQRRWTIGAVLLASGFVIAVVAAWATGAPVF
jgi:hypothetical protein